MNTDSIITNSCQLYQNLAKARGQLQLQTQAQRFGGVSIPLLANMDDTNRLAGHFTRPVIKGQMGLQTIALIPKVSKSLVIFGS